MERRRFEGVDQSPFAGAIKGLTIVGGLRYLKVLRESLLVCDMKTIRNSLALAIVLSLSLAPLHQASGAEATTPIVGFHTLDVKGAPDGSVAFNVVGVGVFNSTDYQGVLSAVNGAAIEDANANFNAGQFDGGYFVEFLGDSIVTGLIVDIVSTAPTSLTLAEDLSAALQGNEPYQIRKHHTLNSLFPADSGLNGGFFASLADQVGLFDPATEATFTFFYHSSRQQWESTTVAGVDAGDTIIHPGQGMIISRRGTDDLGIKVLGTVRGNKTLVPIEDGFNVLGNVVPIDVSLDQLAFENSLTGGVFASLADQVSLFDAISGATQSFFYHTVRQQWEATNQAGVDAGNAVIPAGGGFIIKNEKSGMINIEIASAESIAQP